MLTTGYIHGIDKGLYAILPIGQRVVDKLVRVIEHELNILGAAKVNLPLLGSKELWSKAGRWERMGSEMFQVKDRNKKEYCLQPTAEEMFTKSVSELGPRKRGCFPLMMYQTNHKFRDEMRPKFGLFRSREFLMNDLYSFDLNEEDALLTYDAVSKVYYRILHDILGLEVYVVEADNGDIGGTVSHEYHLPSSFSDQKIYYCRQCNKGVTSDLFARGRKPCDHCAEACVSGIQSVEIAHTFQLGTEFSKYFKAVQDSKFLLMNCFGFGIGRIIAAAIDVLSADGGAIRLPSKIAPFKVAVIPPSKSTQGYEAEAFANSVIRQLADTPQLEDDLYVDDRLDYSVGKRITLASNLGIPHIFAMGSFTARSLGSKPQIEYFRTENYKKEPREMGALSHSEVFKLVKSL